MFPGELVLTLRLSDERLRHRDYKVAHMPGSLRPSVAAALGWLSEPAPDDIVLDPMCGAGTVLIERAYLGRYQQLIGGDSNPAMLEAAPRERWPSLQADRSLFMGRHNDRAGRREREQGRD